MNFNFILLLRENINKGNKNIFYVKTKIHILYIYVSNAKEKENIYFFELYIIFIEILVEQESH